MINSMLQARYCDEECRSADWARHGEYCVLMQQKIRKKKEAKLKMEEEMLALKALQIWSSSHGDGERHCALIQQKIKKKKKKKEANKTQRGWGVASEGFENLSL